MALILNGTTGITVTDGSNILQDGTVTTDDLAAGAVTSAKMATGAAATNLGNYVQSFNGSTGAVTGVSTVNGSTGAVTVQATLVSGSNIKTINGASILGSGDVTAGTGNMTYDTNTAQTTTNYQLGTYVMALTNQQPTYLNTGYSLKTTSGAGNPLCVFSQENGGNVFFSGTWYVRGRCNNTGVSAGDFGTKDNAFLMQRVA